MWCTLLSDLEVPTLELVRHQEHGQVLVDAAQATAVYLDKLEGRGLEELLKHHPVLTLDKKMKSITGFIPGSTVQKLSNLLSRCHTDPQWSQSLQQKSSSVDNVSVGKIKVSLAPWK